MKSEYKTKSRNSIIEYLKKNADTRFTAGDICEELLRQGDSINRSTIYRNLERLSEEGKLIRYKETDKAATCYQYSEGHGHCRSHMHAQCEKCGKIFHLDNDFAEDFEEKLKRVYGLGVDLGKSVIVGTCTECKEEELNGR